MKNHESNKGSESNNNSNKNHQDDCPLNDASVVTQLLSYLDEHYNKHFTELHKKIETTTDAIKDQVNTRMDDLNSRIEYNKMQSENDIDGIDKTLRGNGKIGLIEQIRTLRRLVKIFIILTLLVAGIKIYGIAFDDYVKKWFVPQNGIEKVKQEVLIETKEQDQSKNGDK